MGGAAIPLDVHAAGVDWWKKRFPDLHDDHVRFTSSFLPALLASCRFEWTAQDALSLDELRVIAKYCIADSAWQHDTISLTAFTHFLARFGPLESSLQRLVESFTVHRELVTWFHGSLTRAESDKILLGPSATSLDDGAFLVRYSDSQPSRLCVSYLKIHSTGPHVGQRETRNVLIENAGSSGYVLTDSNIKVYPSIRAFVQRTAARLKYGIASPLSQRCNLELAAVRARQDLASNNAYTTFSTDSLEPSSSSSPSSPSFRIARPPASLLFTESPPPERMSDNQEDHFHERDEDENYSGFAKSALLSSLPIKTPTVSVPPHASAFNTSGYGSFSAASVVRTPPGSPARKEPKIPFITLPVGTDYQDFSAFTSAVTSFSKVSGSPPRSPPGQNQSDNDYATFDSFVPRRTSTPPTFNSSHTSSAPEDSYGTFEAFEVNARPPPRPAVAPSMTTTHPRALQNARDDYGSFAALTQSVQVAPPRNPAALQVESDDYGSFAALSLSPESAPQSVPVVQHLPPPASTGVSNSDVYGTFTLSPTVQSQSYGTTNSASMPPLARDSTRPSGRSSQPPQSLPSDTYGSFDAFVEQEKSLDTGAPHSAPAEPTTTLEPTSDGELETKVSPLDELNEGMELYKQKRLDDALLRFIRAREVAQVAKDMVVEARALGNLGTVYLEKQNPQQAVKCYQQSLEITRSIQDVKRERLILNNLVLALMAAEDYVSAYNYCQIQLETTVSEVNRRKIFTRMSELRERAARASRATNTGLRQGQTMP